MDQAIKNDATTTTSERNIRVIGSKRKLYNRNEDELGDSQPRKVSRPQQASNGVISVGPGALSQVEQLCERCQNIDFDKIFNMPKRTLPVDGRPILDLSDNVALWQPWSCPLCRLLLAVRYPERNVTYPNPGCHLRAWSSLTVLSVKATNHHKPSVVLSVMHRSPTKELWLWERTRYASRGLILPVVERPVPTVPKTFYGGCRIDTNVIDYGRIREWLSECDRLHTETCGLSDILSTIPLKCIDCLTREVVQIDPHIDYLALSYVWGAPSLEEKEQNTGPIAKLPNGGVPEVIEDAIVFVQKLGRRYLWVDKYCIDQNDDDTKHLQIQNMDHVYEASYATIVAATGTDASSGLPGIGRVPRKPQPSAVAGNRQLVSSLPPLSWALKGTKWITRGWTYQEAILSRRCLFVTDLQVYFICASASYCEAVITGLQQRTRNSAGSAAILSADNLVPSVELRENPIIATPLRKFADHISKYSARQLTVEGDIMNAFRGLLKRSSFHNYYGIPIASGDSQVIEKDEEFNVGFAQGLYWITGNGIDGDIAGSLIRRPDFPSWSWMGWRGGVTFPGKFGAGDGRGREGLIDVNRTFFDTKFWLRGENGKRITLEELRDPASQYKLIPELSQYLVIEAWVVHLQFRERSEECVGLIICRCHPQTRHEGPRDVCDLWAHLIPCQPLWKGSELYERLNTQLSTCILLFESDSYESRTSKTKLYNLLVIDWHGEIAQRIGAITISDPTGKFDDLKKERRTILLG
jgi:hypothetical protein